jgi:5-formyltetrahydrofolate cyclo-ligase
LELTGIDGAKAAVRERIWNLLEKDDVVPIPPAARGRIPNFRGSAQATSRILDLAEWCAARVIKANPDKAQSPLRRLALEQGTTVYMAVPRLAREKPFVALDPAKLAGMFDAAATSEGGVALGQPVDPGRMEPIQLVVCGSVAVNRDGVRIGKGGGFSDIEVALLADAGLVQADTPVVTTVHGLQLLDEDLPEADHDFRVDWIATPDEILRSPGQNRRRPTIQWEHLTKGTVTAIPALTRLDKTELLNQALRGTTRHRQNVDA